MGGKQNKCCCGASLRVYTGWSGNSDIYEIDPNSQTYILLATYASAPARTYDIVCDPTTGNIYIASASGATGTVFCLNSLGSTIWSASIGSVIYSVAASAAGFVYVAANGGAIHKLQSSDGTAITTGGWPYTHGGGFIPRCVCVDQSDNVYAGGDNTARDVRALSLDSVGSLRWTSNVSNVALASEGSSSFVTGIGVNAIGGQVVCSRVINTTTTTNSHYHLNASTGAITGSFKDVSPSNGIDNVGRGQNCVYGPAGDSYTTQIANATNRYTVLKNIAQYFRFPTAITATSIAVTRAGDEYVVLQTTGAEFYSITGGWSIDLPTRIQTSIETNEGKIGAFGL